MADQASTLRESFEQACDNITAIAEQRDRFISRQSWGGIDFRQIENEIDGVFWLARELRTVSICIVPDAVVESATMSMVNIRVIFGLIEGFNLAENPTSTRDTIVNKFRNIYYAIASDIGLWLPLLALQSGQMENWSATMKHKSAETTIALQKSKQAGEVILQKAKQASEDRLKDIEKIAEAARAAAGKAGAAEFTHEFRQEAAVVEKRSKSWLWPAGIFAMFALILSGSLMLGVLIEDPESIYEAVYRLGGRVITISVLFYAAIWSGRIALANMHLANVNKHRAISLQTLQAFRQAASDEVSKDAVVLEAARAVYENVPSGFIGKHASDKQGGSRILELIRSIDRKPGAGNTS